MNRPGLVGTSAAALLAMAGAADANVYWSFTNGNNYNWRVTYMPDFDQKRDSASGILGLPGDGSMYCVPTATLNIAAYVARHGYPFVNPGPIYFPANNAQYNTVTANLATLGVLMGTSATDGTGGNGWFNGAKVWFNPFFFDVQFKYASGGWSPKTWNLFQYGQMGGLTTFAYGRYEHVANLLTERTGGHAVTTSKVAVAGGAKEIWFRNPSSSGSLFNQAPYAHDKFPVQDKVFITGSGIRTMTEIITTATDGRLRIIDGVVIVYPRFGLWNTDPDSIVLNFPLQVHLPNQAAEPMTFDFDGLQLVDFEMDPLLEHLVAIVRSPVGGPAQVVGVIPQTREHVLLATAVDPGQMCISPDGLIYLIDRTEVVCINPYDPKAEQPRFPLPPGCDPLAIASHDVMDQIAVLCDGSVLVAIPMDFKGDPQIMPLSGEPLKGDLDLDFSPLDDSLWVCGTDGNIVQQHVIDPKSGRYLPAVQIEGDEVLAPRSIQVDNMGDVFFVSQGKIQHWEPVDRAAADVGGGYQPAKDSLWAGMESGNRLQMSRGRDNFDPDTMSGPSFFNVLPEGETGLGETVPDCLTDINFDGRTDFEDLNLLLGNFNTNDPWLAGDADGDGDADFGDLNAIVSEINTDCD